MTSLKMKISNLGLLSAGISAPTIVTLLLIKLVEAQIIVIPKTQVEEPFRNNPKWEDFKVAQFDRIKVLETLVGNTWTWLESVGEDEDPSRLEELFVRFHVTPLIAFFRQSEDRLIHGNPYAILDPAIGIHTMESLFQLSNVPKNPNLDHIKILWTEIDAMALSINVYFNETMRLILSRSPTAKEEILSYKTKTFPTWISPVSGEPENGTLKSFTVDQVLERLDTDMKEPEKGNHPIRGLVKLLSSMVQRNDDNMDELNYYCYGNNEFGVLQDIYDVLTDAALYICMADMKKFVLDVVYTSYSTFLKRDGGSKALENRKEMFEDMVKKIKRKIDFEYLDGSDYVELPHPPIFKCDKAPVERGRFQSQWGKNISTGISPRASATFPYDPQAGPQKEDGNVGYIDNRGPKFEHLEFDKNYHGYLEAEIVLNPDGLCRGTCRDYKRITPTCTREKDIDCRAYRNSHCESPDSNCMDSNQCPEYARNCVRASHKVTMCTSAQNNRYYSHFHLHPGRLMGLGDRINDTDGNPSCSGESRVAKERWEMEFGVILRNPQYCELCLCTCLTPQKPEDQHYIDLTPQLVDVEKGYIVSAVRFVQEDKVLRLAVEQGKPVVDGEIDVATTQWVSGKPADKSNPAQTAALGQHGFLRMNFDIVVGEAHQVVTGVRFRLDPEDKSIHLDVQMVPITWRENKPEQISLRTTEQVWIKAQKYPGIPRRPLKFYRPNSPLTQKGPSMPDVVYNSYVEFTTSEYDSDLAQSTIPFFDAQPVHHYDTKRWLQGIGIMHKGKPYSGGFISPIIIPSKGKISADFSEARRRRR